MVEISWADHLENELAELRGRYDELLERYKALEEAFELYKAGLADQIQLLLNEYDGDPDD